MNHHPTLVKNYGPPAFVAARGEGVYLYDDSGKQYLDFGSGIAVTSVGHSHPKWVAALQAQAATLTHCSNLYAIPQQQQLANRLVAQAGAGRLLFCNSGAESNDALIKLARLHGKNICGEEDKRFTVVAAHKRIPRSDLRRNGGHSTREDSRRLPANAGRLQVWRTQ